MSDEKPTKFDAYSKLPAHLHKTSKHVNKFAGAYLCVEVDEDTKKEKYRFDWKSFKAAIDKYPGTDLTFDKFKNVTISSSECTVKVIVDKIVAFLLEALSVTLTPDYIDELTATIKATFTNLKEKSSKGFLDFNKSSNGHNSSWEYRIQFAFPNPDVPSDFYSLITTVKLEANVSDESEWWGLASSTSRNFSATIDAMELVVEEGFTNPN